MSKQWNISCIKIFRRETTEVIYTCVNRREFENLFFILSETRRVDDEDKNGFLYEATLEWNSLHQNMDGNNFFDFAKNCSLKKRITLTNPSMDSKSTWYEELLYEQTCIDEYIALDGTNVARTDIDFEGF